jgi:hypothetical protein
MYFPRGNGSSKLAIFIRCAVGGHIVEIENRSQVPAYRLRLRSAASLSVSRRAFTTAHKSTAHLFLRVSKIDHSVFAKTVHNHVMASVATKLTPEEFASLLAVGNTPVNGSTPAIPTAHSARLIALGYMVDLQGRLRMTTPGRIRIYAGQLAA